MSGFDTWKPRIDTRSPATCELLFEMPARYFVALKISRGAVSWMNCGVTMETLSTASKRFSATRPPASAWVAW
jgi:hypothetical protein